MNLEELQSTVAAAIEPGFRGRLLARGQARSMIWRNGVLPEGAPGFARTLSYDLLSYGDTLLSLAMRIREQQGDEGLARSAFEHAGEAIEAVVSNGDQEDPQRGFLRLLAASAFHLAHLSARAFSMLVSSINSGNLSVTERALTLLILRSLNELESEITDWRLGGMASDGQLIEELGVALDGIDKAEEAEPVFDALNKALTDNFFSGLGVFLVALQTGEQGLVEAARSELHKGLEVTSALNLVPQWWCFRLAIHLIRDLWESSLHTVLPTDPTEGDAGGWRSMRSLFIASLYRRERAEIELWPSQIDAARRSVETSDDLVVSLPTGAGKTRVAELCILRCLSEGKRVVFVAPLRALSAQTEVSLQRTFGPLGKTVSALYGSIGTSGFEGDVLKSRDIVVATPEKLDFALRNDPTIINDVGLIVLDEGHMIGLGEREIRYEVQIQRLLRRQDANHRRIVFLSAILPEGDQFHDFVEWIRRDKEGNAVTADWRPTRIRFGEVIWLNNHARLNLRVGEEAPFVPSFFGQKVPLRGQREALFPRDQREFVLATAWRLVEDGQSVLVYCPERKSVNPYAIAIVDLAARGFIDSVLNVDPARLASTLAIGREWLGEGHPILKCLGLGVAIHHGALPTPFRKEMERLLREGILKITVSSPTLAQGLNLTATTVVMHSIRHFRDGTQKTIDVSQFKNVIGRAGRAFIDVEGLVLFPIFNDHNRLRSQWHDLIGSISEQEMESGLVSLVQVLLSRLNDALGKPDIGNLLEYVVNNAAAWQFPVKQGESEKDRQQAESDWERYLALLDTAILSLLGEQEIEIDQIATHLDNILALSLWQRRLSHHEEDLRELFKSSLESRARSIWVNSTASQRRGYFLAGVGLFSGQKLDAASATTNQLLIQANSEILFDEHDKAIETIQNLAEIIFGIPPFIPDPLPNNWRDVLASWLRGERLGDAGGGDPDILRFVENGLIYKLPWGMEAVRVRAQANGDNVGGVGEMTIEAFDLSLAVPAVETGTLNRRAAMLIQAGFSSRLAAIKAVTDTNAAFTNASGFRFWLNSAEVITLSQDLNWPTTESHQLWEEFTTNYTPPERRIWSIKTGQFPVSWLEEVEPPALGTIVTFHFPADDMPVVMSPAFKRLGSLHVELVGIPSGVFHSMVGTDPDLIEYTYYGPDDLEIF